MNELRCCICNRTNKELKLVNDDVRPYGPGGQPICYSCAMSTQELKTTAEEQLSKIFDSIEKDGRIPTIGNDLYGIQPFDADES